MGQNLLNTIKKKKLKQRITSNFQPYPNSDHMYSIKKKKEILNNIELTHVLQSLPKMQLHQHCTAWYVRVKIEYNFFKRILFNQCPML